MADRDPFGRILVMLYGNLEYDGRVRRMLDVLGGLGDALLVDVADGDGDGRVRRVGDRLQRISVRPKPGSSPIRRHWAHWWATFKAARRFKPDLVVGEDYFAAFPAWLIGRVSGARIVYDAHELIIPCAGVRRSPRNLFWYCLEKWAVRRCDLVIAANPQRARLMQEHYALGTTPASLRNIPSVQACVTGQEEITKCYPALSRTSAEDRIVIYQGDVRLARGIGRFIEALRYLPKAYRLVIAGSGPDTSAVARLAQSLGEGGRFALLGMVPNNRLRSVAASADIGVVTYPYTGLNNIFCAPNKLFEYAQAGIPIIATDQPPLAEVIRKYGIGALIGKEDGPEAIAGAIRSVVESRESFQAGLVQFLRENSWEREAAQILTRIRGLESSVQS